MAAQHFFIAGTYLGSRIISTYREREGIGYGVAGSYIFVCSKCRDVWARVLHDHFASYLAAENRACPAHAETSSDGFLSTTRVFDDHPLTISPNWPLGALRHDFLLAMKLAEAALATQPKEPA